MAKVAVVVTFDRNFLPIAKLFLDSLRLTGHGLDVVACHSDLTPGDASALRRHYRHIRLLDVRGMAYPIGPPSLGDHRLNSAIMYARLLLWSPVFDNYDRLLYMDVDQLVADSLLPLFSDTSFAIVADGGSETILTTEAESEGSAWSWAANINSREMANAGLFCIDRCWRTPEQTRLLGELCVRFHDRLRWGDQSLINVWMSRNDLWPTTDRRFNCQVQLAKGDEAFLTAAVYHYCGMSGNRRRLEYTMKLSLALLRSRRNGRTLLRRLIYVLPPYRRFGIGNATLGRAADSVLRLLAEVSYAPLYWSRSSRMPRDLNTGPVSTVDF